jgi:hypothetical protein
MDQVVPEEGLEPSQGYPYRILSPSKAETATNCRALSGINKAFFARVVRHSFSRFFLVRAQFGHSLWASDTFGAYRLTRQPTQLPRPIHRLDQTVDRSIATAKHRTILGDLVINSRQ